MNSTDASSTVELPVWRFAIDVGGTFTDCRATSPDGTVQRIKVLSSGVTVGTIAAVQGRQLTDPNRCGDADDLWIGYRVTVHHIHNDGRGETFATSVTSFDGTSGTFTVADPLPIQIQAGQSYRLACDQPSAILAIRQALQLSLTEKLPQLRLRLGTTRGTNALLTKSGAPTAFVTTKGFGDLLVVGNQQRPDLFELNIQRPAPVYDQVVEVDERIAADGTVLRRLDESAIRTQFDQLAAEGVAAVAICLLHGYRYPQHEQQIAEIARACGFPEISTSQIAPHIKIVPRGETVVANAYLNPVLQGYLRDIASHLSDDSTLHVMTSAGGLVAAAQFAGKDSLFSGPAGGVVGFSSLATAAGFRDSIGLDMGGTSTDVSRFDGDFAWQTETTKAGVRIVAPALEIETVAAGGGSICGFDGVQLFVGPQSAGAAPGPACYGNGGPLTVTDMNLVLGRLSPDDFPFQLDLNTVRSRLLKLTDEIRQRTSDSMTVEQLANGFLRIANAHMARAIGTISTAKGFDPRDFMLVGFGGAAGQHVCSVARELGMRQVLDPADGSILSAVGIDRAEIMRYRTRGIAEVLSPAALNELRNVESQLTVAVQQEVAAAVSRKNIDRLRLDTTLELRYAGKDTTLPVSLQAYTAAATIHAEFASQHERSFGFCYADLAVEVASIRVTGRIAAEESSPAIDTPVADESTNSVPPERQSKVWFHGQLQATPVLQRANLQTGMSLPGPALVVSPLSTTVVEPGWTADVLAEGHLLLRDGGDSQSANATHPGVARQKSETQTPETADPILLEVFSQALTGIAEQMGQVLQNTSTSVNVKERLDYSCALFTHTGDLVVNAPHMPVHLGSMSETVRHVLRDVPNLSPGDVVITNDPYRGGSHLPDVTVVTPVFGPAGDLRFFAASRAHHAEIGGIVPGSMPAFSTRLIEEGVLIRAMKLIEDGEFQHDLLRATLTAPPYPSRSVEHNLSDIAAQVAANHRGVERLTELIEKYSWPTVSAYLNHLQTAAEQKLRNALAALTDQTYLFCDALDDGSPIQVAITVEADTATFDFTGSAAEHAGNLNANRAIVRAAVLYTLRCLINQELPLNDGVLRPIEIILPNGLLNPAERDSPADCPAVVGGNVETSQRIVDVLLGALGLAAASQGTMNNFLFGDDSFGYYETICGGSGATAAGPGTSAIHTHMTNTRLTDPEVLEHRFPVRLIEFGIRRGSGGAGQHPGGDGAIRTIEFLRTLDVSLLTQRRGEHRPLGLAGGQPGSAGENILHRAAGSTERLDGCAQIKVEPGDRLTIRTPGGGGFGTSR